ncbi:hypothetical protein AMATHDRAFT_66408 [Amanita thiersii Skay4041]|uniref:DUF2264 domain-containing protein n=1 Tax=Amanita thiersii Skay4041 TaxID=703135 RepID=A0A2A9NJM2_9AGAR|nr:hypothetical protein AMATHDRAFT_66408 [Amanita thiersii Skay4041]
MTPTQAFSTNPLLTKADLAAFLTSLLDSLESHTSTGGALIHLGYTGTHYDERAALLEGFARPLWGLGALLAGGGHYPGTKRWVSGLVEGTKVGGEEYWGAMRDKDQRMVECSPIGFALAVAREELWDGIGAEEKKGFEKWLSGINEKQMPDTNWLWFRVFANLGLKRINSPSFSQSRLKADLDRLDEFYVGEGWSRDGPEGVIQLDYYSSSFAIQFAQLVFSKLASGSDRLIDGEEVRCREYRNRARMFALDFVHYFDEQGRAIPFGRSMTYRFAMSAFWGAMAFADMDPPGPLTWGVVKGLQLRNLRYWARQSGAYNPDGTLTIGYCYPNHNLTENYNSPGSPYWCCKSFITLALPDTHPFWTAKEEPYPDYLRGMTKVLEKPLHIMTNKAGHTFLLSSGQQCSYPVKQSAAKYGKLAYSSAFGYSVPTGNGTLEELGGDSTLALSDDGGETWKVRRETKEARIESGAKGEKWLRSMWYPWKDVEVETWLVPPQEGSECWHLRVHRIRSERRLITAEGGWAIYGQGSDWRALAPTRVRGVGDVEKNKEAPERQDEWGVWEEGGEGRAVCKAGVSGIVEISGDDKEGRRQARVVRTDPNSNLMEPRAVVPTLAGSVEPRQIGGNEWLVTAVFGLTCEEGREGPKKGWDQEWNRKASVPGEIAALVSCCSCG